MLSHRQGVRLYIPQDIILNTVANVKPLLNGIGHGKNPNRVIKEVSSNFRLTLSAHMPHYSHAIRVSSASVRIYDWLRIFCLSTDPHTADAERGQGFSAHQCAHNSQIIYDEWYGSASVFKTQGKK